MDSVRWVAVVALVGGCFNPSSAEDGSSGGSTGPGTSGSPTTASGGPTTAGTNPTGDASSATTNADSSSGGSTSCGMNERCVEAAPAGWDGPAARFAVPGVAMPAACVDPLGSVLAAGHVGLQSVAAECSCLCADPVGASCSGTTATDYTDSGCMMAIGGGNLGLTCSSLGGGFPGFIITEPQVDSGSCQASIVENLPEPEMSEARTLCQPTEAPAMCVGEDGLCLPQATNSGYCVSMAGDVQCPADSEYSQRELIYTRVDDSRGCSQCDCADASGTCVGTATLFNAGGCSGASASFPADGNCQPMNSFNTGFLTINAVNASCAASGGDSLGTVVATDLLTLCCTQ